MPKKGWRKDKDGTWRPPDTLLAKGIEQARAGLTADLGDFSQYIADDNGMAQPPEDDAICEDCWPDGWPPYSGDADCLHGHWSRQV